METVTNIQSPDFPNQVFFPGRPYERTLLWEKLGWTAHTNTLSLFNNVSINVRKWNRKWCFLFVVISKNLKDTNEFQRVNRHSVRSPCPLGCCPSSWRFPRSSEGFTLTSKHTHTHDFTHSFAHKTRAQIFPLLVSLDRSTQSTSVLGGEQNKPVVFPVIRSLHRTLR